MANPLVGNYSSAAPAAAPRSTEGVVGGEPSKASDSSRVNGASQPIFDAPPPATATAKRIPYSRDYKHLLKDKSKWPLGWGIMEWRDGALFEGKIREGSFQERRRFYIRTAVDSTCPPQKRMSVAASFEGFWDKVNECPCSRCSKAVSAPPTERINQATECQPSGSVDSP